MVVEDSAYYAKRAEAELEQAQRASSPEVAQLHHQLAQIYLERLKPAARASIEQET